MSETEPTPIPPASDGPTVTPAAQTPVPAAAAATPPAKNKKRRLWWKIVVALIVLLFLLVALIPTILSMGFVRSIVVGKVNDQINGKLAIADWSFGWTSGAHIDGIKLDDAAGSEMLQLKSLDAPVSLIGLARGNYDLHKVVVDGLDFHAVRNADGTLNFETLAKGAPARSPESSAPVPSAPQPAAPAQPEPSTPPASSAAPVQTKLPDVRGEFVITHCTGTIDDLQAKTTTRLTSLEADLKIPDINQPIEDSFEAQIDNGKDAIGKISASGTALMVKNNVLLTDPALLIREADIDQKATLTGFDLATIAPFLGSDGAISKLAGVSDGAVTIRFKPASDADISAMLKVVKLAVGGTALKGDTFAAQSLELAANHIALILPADAKDLDGARFRTGPADGTDPISVTLLQDGGSKSTVTLFADASQTALSRIAKNLTPGDSGTIRAAVDLDLAHLATSMPHIFDLNKGLTLKTGRLTEGTVIDLTPDRLALRQNLAVTDVTGHNDATKTDVTLKPINLSVVASSLGGGGVMPDLRNLKLNLTSGFANATAQANSIDDLTAELHATLEQAQSELGQIFSFGANQLAGDMDLSISSKGNLITGGSARSAALDVHGSLKDLRVTSADKLTNVNEPLMQFSVTGQLQGSDKQAVEKFSGIQLAATAGDDQHRMLDAHIAADLGFDKSGGARPEDGTTKVVLENVKIQPFTLDLALAQQQLGILPTVKINTGQLVIGAQGKQRDAQTTHGIFQAYLQNIDLQKLPGADSSAPVALLNGYTLHLLADMSLIADATGSKFSLASLVVDDNQHMLAVQKADAEVQLTTGSGADAKSVGLLDMVKKAEASIAVPSLSKLHAVLNALSPAPQAKVASADAAPAAPPKPQMQVTAGSATMALNITGGNGTMQIDPKLNISPDFAIAAGDQKQVVGPVDFVTDVVIKSADPSDSASPAPSLIDQIKQIDISNLSAHAVGTEIALKQPLHITDVAGLEHLLPSTQPSAAPAGAPASLNAALLVKGDLAPLTHLLETLDGAAPGSEYPYTGLFQLDETVGTSNGNMSLNGQGDITQFVLHSGDAAAFSESDIHLANDVGLENGGSNLKIGGLNLDMQSSKALSLAVKGELLDFAKQRQFKDTTADLTYDAAPLWKIVLPLLSKDTQDKFKDAVVSGKFTKHFTVGGSFPAGPAFNEAIKNLSASGGIELGVFQGQGIDLEKLNVPIFLKNGKAYIANSDKPGDVAPPASMNGGTISLSGVVLDLGDVHRTVSMQPNSQLMNNVTLNTALAHLLGEKLGNLLFADAGGSSGIMNVTVQKCEQVPTDDTMKLNVPSNKGSLAMDIQIQNLSLTGGTFGKALDAIGPALELVSKGQSVHTKSIQGSVKDYKITLAHGVTTHDMTMTLGERQRSLHLGSTVDLLKLQLKDTVLTLPVSLFGLKDTQWPNGINLPITGTATSPKFDALGAVQKSVIGKGNPLDLLNNVIGGKKKGANAGSSDSGQGNGANNGLDALQGLFGGKKKNPPPSTDPGN